jgi:transcriptional regulator with XRE-family HTH domain
MRDVPVAFRIENLGERIAQYRLSRNLRQKDVAASAGVSRGVLTRLETGKGGTIDSLVRVLKALDMDDRVLNLVPDARMSPLDPRASKDSRQRARKIDDKSNENEPWSWAE